MQVLEHTLTMYEKMYSIREKKYSINFTATKKKFRLNLHYNGANSYLFVNGAEIYKFKVKDSEIVATPFQKTGHEKNWI